MTADEQLLAAAFLDGDRAREAWVAWRDSVDIEVLEPAQEKVLPQLYRNLSAMGVQDPVVERLRSSYRHTWVANQLLLRSIAHAIAALARAGVDARLVGDAALALTAYKDFGARRIELAELLVPRAERRRALRALKREGWSTVGPAPRRHLRPLTRGRQMLSDAEGQRLRISWRYSATAWLDGEPPIETEIHDVRVLVPSVLAQLAAACGVASACSGSDVSRLADVLAITRAMRLDSRRPSLPDGHAVDLDQPQSVVGAHPEDAARREAVRPERGQDLG